jgi:Ser/Thr protein kinase RdoA (MazF antagonist)
MMNRQPIPVRASELEAEPLGTLAAEAYGLGSPVRCRLVSSSLNDVYRIESGGERYFLRVGPTGWRTETEVEAECHLLDHLATRGVPVARALRTSSGSPTLRIEAPEGLRIAALMTDAPGTDVRDIGSTHARTLGRLAAQVHAATDDIGPVWQRPLLDEGHLLDEPLAAIRTRLEGGTGDLHYLEWIADRIRERLTYAHRDGAGFGLCHGDLHPANVRFAPDGSGTLFDFDCSGYGWRGYDLAVFLWNAYGERRPKRWREARWRSFLAGYREVRAIDEVTLELVPLFIVARQIWLAGMDYAGITNWPPQWLTAESFSQTVAAVRAWVQEFPILHSL